MKLTVISNTDHITKINDYVNWLFKRKEPFVILKQFKNTFTNETKMFLALPVRERVFESTKKELFNPTMLNHLGFPYREENIKEYKTLYSGDIFKFYDIPVLLSTFTLTKTTIASQTNRYNTIERFKLFKDYTRTRQEQKDSFALVQSFTSPDQSVNSIYRLLNTKYVTIISITFKSI